MLGPKTVGKKNFLTLYALYTIILNCHHSFWNVFLQKIDFSIENCQKLLFLVEIHRKLVYSVASQLKIGQSYIEFRLFAQTICAF